MAIFQLGGQALAPNERAAPEGGSAGPEDDAIAPRAPHEPPAELPDLPRFPCKDEDILPPPSPERGWLPAVGYALRTVGLARRIRTCRAVAERRIEILHAARDDLHVAIGQRAWDDEIPTEALAFHRAAIEQARSESVDLEGQVAALDAVFAEDVARTRASIAASLRRAEGLERQYAEKDRLYQRVVRETSEAASVLRDAEKELAALRKRVSRLTALPEGKRRDDYEQDLGDLRQEVATLDAELSPLRERVGELNAEQAMQKKRLAELRDRVRVERAGAKTTQKELDARRVEAEGQKAALRGAIVGAAEALREPLVLAGRELDGRREDVPAFSRWFAALDRHDEVLADEERRAAAFHSAEEAYDTAQARRGYALLTAAAVAVGLVALVIVLLSAVGRPPLASWAWTEAFPRDVDAVIALDVAAVVNDETLRPVSQATFARLAEFDPWGDLATAGLPVAAVRTAAVALRFDDDTSLRWLLALEADLVPDELSAALVEHGYERRTAESGATRFVHTSGQLVLSNRNLVLYAPSGSAALIDASPMLSLDRRPAAVANEELAALAERVERRGLVWAVGTPPASLVGGAGGPPAKRAALSLVLSAEDLRIHVHLRADGDTEASAWANTARDWLGGGRRAWVHACVERLPAIASLEAGLNDALDAVTVTVDGEGIDLRGGVKRSWLTGLVERLAPMLPAILNGIAKGIAG